MKIGVALSGCDLGGLSAFFVLRRLEEAGIRPAMLSACGVPAAPALLYARGFDEAEYRGISERYLQDACEGGFESAVAGLAAAAEERKPGRTMPLAVNTVDVATGKILTFTNDFYLDAEKLATVPLDKPRDALGATIGLTDGLSSYQFGDYRLCDYSCWYGCPLYPLKMAGIQRIVSLAFLPKHPKTSYEVLARHMAERTGRRARLHIPIEFAGQSASLEDYEKVASDTIDKFKLQIMLKTLF